MLFVIDWLSSVFTSDFTVSMTLFVSARSVALGCEDTSLDGEGAVGKTVAAGVIALLSTVLVGTVGLISGD